MKALICDLCGYIAPDVPEASLIQAVTISRGKSIVLERDVCLSCLEKLIMGLEPKDFVAPEANKVAPEANPVISDQGFTPGINEAIDFTLAMAELKEKPKSSPEFPATIDSSAKSENEGKAERKRKADLGTVTCAQCGNDFVARSAASKFCSKACVNLDYKAKQKKARTPEVDAMLKKLKAENPAPVRRPRTDHEFVI